MEVHLSGKQIRVLAHPLRARLLGALRLGGPATATKLAGQLGTNTGATSYHLRQLADVGLVAEDATPGRGRERWWRAAHESSSWQSDDFAGDPDARAAAEWMQNFWLRRFTEQAEAWHRNQGNDSKEWRAAANFSDYWLELSAEQLEALTEEVDAVIERYRALPPPADARKVNYYVYGFPRQADGS
ncbi:winged helix-turn-helix domain-containing protein [Symbioplanes lichenis]|uniref:winged helix-turn-helix domain-containing protein n=1 Tax=Symbioplanes lichenis TaxID=1629072 RepID=UPI00273A4E78|nr:helix-turn-helix domain-containing protein [Actinoplanes lichenis]